MNIDPLGKTRLVTDWAIVTAAGVHGLEMIDSTGKIYRRRRGEHSRYALAEIDGIVFSAVKPRSLIVATDARYWSGKLWQGAITNLKMDGGPKVIPLRKVFDDATPYEMAESLAAFSEAIGAQGVALGSLSGMAWNLWRSSLARPLRISGPGIRDALHGGRKEALFPGEYKSVGYWDISAAYPNAQASEGYATRMRRIDPKSSIDEGQGLAFARVKIPRLTWGPIPVKIGENGTCYGWGTAEGWWTWRDLRLAREAGCSVTIFDSFAGFHYNDIFGEWWKQSHSLRALPSFTGRLAKAVTSTLWGQFALTDSVSELVRWSDSWGKTSVTVPLKPRTMPHKWISHIAAETTSRVREKLWNEGLSVPSAIYCDTDAVICGKSEQPTAEGWTEKNGILNVDIRGPQAYRYTCISCGDSHPNWHYVVGGISSREGAERVFRREHKRHGINLGVSHDGITIPAMDVQKALELMPSNATG